MAITKEITYLVQSDQDNNVIKRTENISFNINNDTAKQMYIIHRALKQQLTNNRIRNAHSKTRSEVKGGGKKPWKQKGTGRARAGSNNSPLWRGGGVIFGPRKKQYTSKINKKEKKLAIHTALYNKLGQTIVIDKLLDNLKKPSTKSYIKYLNTLGIDLKYNKKILIIIDKKLETLFLSLRNVANIKIITADSLNILCLLESDIILVTVNALKNLVPQIIKNDKKHLR
uniref:Large ribosomal subunit protein uL4c n=1 Tax=Cliftonaea pectinata TaxID=2007206 RepID=A0A1Z1MQN0_9FLOR|nr:ribosomal protein L4 [Cliftonaea pectinata]ARW68054.1 ribosomal protein L4 [Cliftonaea pectinata]